MLYEVLIIIYLIVAIALVGLILIQQGKGADMGASFGAGASQTMFGSSGSWNFFSKMTAIFATVFFVTSISLAVSAKRSAEINDPYLPEMEEIQLPESTSDLGLPVSGAEDSEIPTLEDEGEVPVLDPIPQEIIERGAEVPVLDGTQGSDIESAAEQDLISIVYESHQ